MKFVAYLNESKHGSKTRSKVITSDEAVDIIKKKCSTAYKAYIRDKSTQIFRGMSGSGNYKFVDPSKHIRKSAHTKNYYTLLIDNLPAWKNYPKRSKSIVCTTNLATANIYGIVYIVFPFNGSKIGVCKGNDIWYSFKKVKDMYNFNIDLYEYVYDLIGEHLNDDSWSKFVSQIKKVDKVAKNFPDHIFVRLYYLQNWWDKYDSLLNVLADFISPNEFQIKKVGDPLPQKREVWMDGKSVLIKHSLFDDIMDKLQ